MSIFKEKKTDKRVTENLHVTKLLLTWEIP